jgi:hypothetical protein
MHHEDTNDCTDRFLLQAKSAFPTSLWVMQEVEQCRSNCRGHKVFALPFLRELRVFVVNQ